MCPEQESFRDGDTHRCTLSAASSQEDVAFFALEILFIRRNVLVQPIDWNVGIYPVNGAAKGAVDNRQTGIAVLINR